MDGNHDVHTSDNCTLGSSQRNSKCQGIEEENSVLSSVLSSPINGYYRIHWKNIWIYYWKRASQVAQKAKNLPAMQELQVQSLGWEDPLEKGMANLFQYSCLENSMDRRAWWATVHWVAKRHDWATNTHTPLESEEFGYCSPDAKRVILKCILWDKSSAVLIALYWEVIKTANDYILRNYSTRHMYRNS